MASSPFSQVPINIKRGILFQKKLPGLSDQWMIIHKKYCNLVHYLRAAKIELIINNEPLEINVRSLIFNQNWTCNLPGTGFQNA